MVRYFTVGEDTLGVFAGLCEEDARERFSELSVAMGAIHDEDGKAEAAGILIGHPTATDFTVDWIYVAPQFRRQGIGRELFFRTAEAVSALPEMDGIMTVISGEEEDLCRFFSGIHAMVLPAEGRGQYRANLGQLSLPPRKQGKKDESVPLGSIPLRMLRALEQRVEKVGGVVGVPFPIVPEQYAPESRVIYGKDEISDILLLKQEEDGYNIAWVYSYPKFSKRLVPLFLETFEEIIKTSGRRPEEITVSFGVVNEAAMELAEHLFPGAEFENLMIAYLDF